MLWMPSPNLTSGPAQAPTSKLEAGSSFAATANLKTHTAPPRFATLRTMVDVFALAAQLEQHRLEIMALKELLVKESEVHAETQWKVTKLERQVTELKKQLNKETPK